MPILTHEERLGTLLAGKYRLDSIIGRGGMGAVFAGRHEWTGRAVAVKLLNHEFVQLPDVIERFFREARSAASIKHPNVVDVLDMGKDDDGTVYLVLERLEGAPLSDIIDHQGAMDIPTAFALLIPIMRALAMAHGRGVVHRDLKPDNIFLAEVPEAGTVPKLLDFGIAKLVESEHGASVTRTGAVVGTPEYMSPEQAIGASDVGPSSDVWSMGVVWYEALSGVVPFSGPNLTSVLLAIVNERAKPILSKAPKIPIPIAAAIHRALERDRSARYADMTSFAEALLAAAKEAGIAVPIAPRATVPNSSQRSDLSAEVTSDTAGVTSEIVRLEQAAKDPDVAIPLIPARPDTRMTWTSGRGETRSNLRTVILAGAVTAVAAAGILGWAFRGARSSQPHGSPPVASAPPHHDDPPSATQAPPLAAPTPAVPSQPATAPTSVAEVQASPVAPIQPAPVTFAPNAAAHGPNHHSVARPVPTQAATLPAVPPTPIAPPPPTVQAPPPAPVAAAPPPPAPEPVHHHPRPPARDPNAPVTDYEKPR